MTLLDFNTTEEEKRLDSEIWPLKLAKLQLIIQIYQVAGQELSYLKFFFFFFYFSHYFKLTKNDIGLILKSGPSRHFLLMNVLTFLPLQISDLLHPFV